MRDCGVTQLYLKRLAANDNSKNQVYLGSTFESLNILPNRGVQADRTTQEPIFKAALDLSWLSADGKPRLAPNAQLILYPQYPEVRLSGFLRGSARAPSSLMTVRQPGRLLFLGVSDDRRIFGHVAAHDGALAKEVEGLRGLESVGVFETIPLEAGAPADSRTGLLTELGRVHRLGWVDSKRLIGLGLLGPCRAPNCGGYTLEAELGILPNSLAEPDFDGWEIKQHSVPSFDRLERGVVTLMTPEPTGGLYSKEGVERFVRKFGYPDKLGRPDRINFGGLHYVDLQHPRTGLTLALEGFNATKGTIVDPTGGITLRSQKGELAAKWRYADLLTHWNRKHAKAAYIPSLKRDTPSLAYSFGPEVRLGEGTDFLRFLKAMDAGAVYYDPGIKLENASTKKPTTKRRSQFRVKSGDLAALYGKFERVPVL